MINTLLKTNETEKTEKTTEFQIPSKLCFVGVMNSEIVSECHDINRNHEKKIVPVMEVILYG